MNTGEVGGEERHIHGLHWCGCLSVLIVGDQSRKFAGDQRTKTLSSEKLVLRGSTLSKADKTFLVKKGDASTGRRH